MTPPGIAVALRAELRTLTHQTVAPGACVRLPGAQGPLVAWNGVGPERARAAGVALLERGASALVSWGTAAGLDPGLPAGSLVVPERVIGGGGAVYPVEPSSHARLRARLLPELTVHAGALVDASGLLHGADAKRALFERHGAVAADLESAALAALAAEREVPFLAVRAIADPAGARVPVWVTRYVDPAGRVRAVALLRAALAHFGDWPALLMLGVQFGAARRTLRHVAARAGPVLLG